MTFPFRATLKFLLVIALLSPAAFAVEYPFVGTWKLNPNKTQFAGQVAGISDLGSKNFQRVYAGVLTEYSADGKDHPCPYGGTYSVSQESPERWVFTGKRDGRVVSVGVWTLSEGGRQVKTNDKVTRPDGSSYTVDMKISRIGTGSGFIGTWESQKPQVSSSSKFLLQPYRDDGLVFAWPEYKEHLDIKFDGQDYRHEGPQATAAATTSGKRPDGKTLTITGYATGQKKPTVAVFDKQM